MKILDKSELIFTPNVLLACATESEVSESGLLDLHKDNRADQSLYEFNKLNVKSIIFKLCAQVDYENMTRNFVYVNERWKHLFTAQFISELESEYPEYSSTYSKLMKELNLS